MKAFLIFLNILPLLLYVSRTTTADVAVKNVNIAASNVGQNLRRGDGVQRRNSDESQSSSEKPAWMEWEEIDGLKNEDIVMLVTSTSIRSFSYIRERIIPSTRTWMKMFANHFVIVEDTFEARFALRHCQKTDGPRLTTFSCLNETTYVLSRKCTSQYYGGPGPCCKVDDIFTYITMDRPELFAHTKYVLHADDDTYFRVDQVMRWLAAIENSGMSTFPLIGNDSLDNPNATVWHIKNCTEIRPNGWYQPMMLNHAAMELIKNANAAYGLMETCSNFVVTHDVGMGPFAWLFGLYHIYIPYVNIHNKRGYGFHPGNMILHALKHGTAGDSCSNRTAWAEGDVRYQQDMVVGCGNIGRPSPGHNMSVKEPSKAVYTDMYDGWEYYRQHGGNVTLTRIHGRVLWTTRNVTLYPAGTMLKGVNTPGDENKVKVRAVLGPNDKVDSKGMFGGYPVVERYVPDILKLKGYDSTEHSRRHDIVKKWHEFKLSDCKYPGSIAK